MSTYQYQPFKPPLFCLSCGDPIRQPRRGGRYRLYCTGKCRKAANRSTRKFEHAQAKDNLLRSLRKQWKQLDSPTTVYTLEQIVRIYGVEPAALATQAIIQELEARVKNP